MSRTTNGIEPTPAAILGRSRLGDALPRISRVPKLTLVWAAGMVLGLALLIGSRPPADVRPLALASPTPAPAAVQEVESRLAELAARVRALEAEVAELRSPAVHASRRVVQLED